MLIATKIKLFPTKEQETLFWKSAGVARWAYNYFLATSEEYYKENKKNINECDVRKYINNVLKKTTHTWLKDVGSNVMKQAVKDASRARDRWFKGLSKKPKFKCKKESKISFYVNYESLKKMNGGFRGEKIGFVKTHYPLPKLKKDEKYSNPRISFDGRSWYLSVGYNKEFEPVILNGTTLGIDVGIKNLAVCSDGEVKININKTKRVRFLKKKLRREQVKISRKIQSNILRYGKNRKPIFKKPLNKMKNIQKQKALINRLYRKLTNIRSNHIHQTTNAIVKTKPSRIVMETLNIQGMMKNRHLSKAIAEQCLYDFKTKIKYKCEKYGIEFIEADKWYPSSKMCSCCGHINKDLKLSDRVYKCSCGLVIDRDLNAAINLANYSIQDA